MGYVILCCICNSIVVVRNNAMRLITSRLRVLTISITGDLIKRYYNGKQGRIQDLKKESAQGVRGLAQRFFLANLGDFLKSLAQKGVGVRPPLDPRLVK